MGTRLSCGSQTLLTRRRKRSDREAASRHQAGDVGVDLKGAPTRSSSGRNGPTHSQAAADGRSSHHVRRPYPDPPDERSGGGDWPRTTRLLPWSLAAFMGIIWLLPFDSITLPIPFPLDGKLDRPILVAIGMLWFLTLVAVTGDARPRLRLTGIHIVAVLFFLTACVAPLLNVEALVNVGEFDLVLKKLSLLASYIVLFFIVSSTVRPREIPRFVNLMLGLACIAAIGTAVEYRFEFNPFYSWSAQLPLLSVALPSDLYALDSSAGSACTGLRATLSRPRRCSEWRFRSRSSRR